MKSIQKPLFVIGLISVFISCNRLKTSNTIKDQFISSSCDLKGKVNDTIVIKGVYATCMEYSWFNTLKNGECSENYSMQLKFSWKKVDSLKIKSIYKMYACNASREMTLKGILKKDKEGYGHLGSNNHEFFVIDILELKDIKYKITNE